MSFHLPFQSPSLTAKFPNLLSSALAFVLCATAPTAQATQLEHGDDHYSDESEMDAEPLESSPVFPETYPDGSRPKPATEPEFSATSTSGAIAPAAGQPPGALTGRIVYTSGGHGWVQGSNGWSLQRPLLLEMNEDYGNRDQMSMFAEYCFNAGATVVPFRPVGYQTNEVVINNIDPEVTWSGSWSNSQQTTYYGNPGEVPYRFASLSSGETATATYQPNIPEAGFYPVYTWVLHGPDRTSQLYKIFHTGGESQVRVPHHMVGSGWVYLGTYYFEAGSDAAKGSVVISNLQPSPAVGSVVIADAIRFGNGMSNDGSTYPKEDEATSYWVKNSLGEGQSSTLYSSSVSAPPRMAREMNYAPNSPIFKSIYLGFHTNAGGGSARGSLGLHNGNHPGTSTPNQFRWAELVGKEVNDQMVAMSPFLEVPWHHRSVVTLSRSDIAFGEINDRRIDGEFDATIIESGYHDNASDALILRDPKGRNWIARACYRAVVKYMNEFDEGPLNFLPEPPRNVSAVANDSGGVVVSWDVPVESAGSGAPESYVVYRSTNGYGFGDPVFVSGETTTSVTLDDVPADTELYFRVAARNAGGESFPSETVGCRRSSNSADPRVLVVNDYSRFERSINIRQTLSPSNYRAPGHDGNSGGTDRIIPRSVNSFDYVVQHGRGISAHGMAFDSCRSDVVVNNDIDLDDYQIVVWACGQDSVPQETFSSSEQSRVSNFLDSGGALFVSGSDIAYDLGRPSGPSVSDRAFLNDTLHVSYNDSDSNVYTVSPVAGSLFAGLSNAIFDNGTRKIYPVRSPDVISPHGTGAERALNFVSGANSAVQYDASAGGGRVVFLSFPFETIANATLRDQYIASAFDFLSVPPDDAPPSILAQPKSQSVIVNADIVLSVENDGYPAPEFQWQFNGADIPGAENSTLLLSQVQVEDAGNYRVVVSNPIGSVTSEIATVDVHAVPPKPVLLNAGIGLNGEGDFEAEVLGEPGAWFLAEASIDLDWWVPLTTLKIDTAPVSFFDPDWPAFDRRFYRAREVPTLRFTDFASYPTGANVMFREPSYRGPTSDHIATGEGLPDFVQVAAEFPDGIDRSKVLHASWSFASGTTDPWLRLTTFNALTLGNPTVDFSHGLRLNVYVDRPVYLVLGLRETDSTAEIGEDGGSSGHIEWIGGRTDNSVSPALGQFIPAGEWTAVDIFVPFEPVQRVTGNGVLESTTGKGVLEHLGIVPADGTGVYNLYLDDFRAVELFSNPM